MTKITWIIEWMKTTSNASNPPTCVIECGWRCNGEDDQYGATVCGTSIFKQPGDPFIPYSELTQDQVLQWCWNSSISKDAVELSVVRQIETQKNPPVIQPPLPWA